jgi:hypothetical protein
MLYNKVPERNFESIYIQNIYFTKFQSLLKFGILFWGGMGGEENTRIFKIQKKVVRSMVGVSSRVSCRQLLKK